MKPTRILTGLNLAGFAIIVTIALILATLGNMMYHLIDSPSYQQPSTLCTK